MIVEGFSSYIGKMALYHELINERREEPSVRNLLFLNQFSSALLNIFEIQLLARLNLYDIHSLLGSESAPWKV